MWWADRVSVRVRVRLRVRLRDMFLRCMRKIPDRTYKAAFLAKGLPFRGTEFYYMK